LMVRESAPARAIGDCRFDFRWAAVRHVCTFSKPDLIAMVGGPDGVGAALDAAAASGGHDARMIGRLRGRYRRAVLGEALVMAARHGDEEQAGRLVGMGADACAAGPGGEKPLIAAARGGYGAGVIRLLLAHGAGRDGSREEAACIARRCGHEANIRALDGG
jgi:hypothetical protein